MSAEVITIAISAVGLLWALAGGFAWTIQRMDLGEVKVGVARLERRLERRLILPG